MRRSYFSLDVSEIVLLIRVRIHLLVLLLLLKVSLGCGLSRNAIFCKFRRATGFPLFRALSQRPALSALNSIT